MMSCNLGSKFRLGGSVERFKNANFSSCDGVKKRGVEIVGFSSNGVLSTSRGCAKSARPLTVSNSYRIVRLKLLAALAGFVVLTSICTPLSWALGVGGVENKSYIGQPLLLEIPLYNVVSPNTLQLSLERLNGNADEEGLTAELSRANSQLSIVIRSSKVVNEPYYNFALNLVDQGNEFRKQFTVLLDLSPPLNTSAPSSDSANKRSQDNELRDLRSQGSVMGPYDWAQKGAIAERFGAVLDGQSLWRVARRISPAMGVTNNQMMWALYSQNPQAFSSRRIESLKAGSYLSIPSTAAVTGVSDSEAKKRLASLSNSNASLETNTPKEAEVESAANRNVESNPDADSNSEKGVPSEAGNQSFQMSGLEKTVDKEGALITGGDSESRQIITSLSETILSMTEQLGNKDKKIRALEAQVSDLKAVISNDRALVGDDLSSITEPSIDEATSDVFQQPVNVQESVAIDAPLASQPIFENKAIWWVMLFGLAALALLMMRHKLIALWRSLNFSGEQEQIEFRSVVSEMVEDSAKEDRGGLELILPEPKQFSSSSVTEENLEYSEPYSEEASDIFVDEDLPEDELDFEQRMARAMAENELEFADQLLEISKGHDVDNERYHFYRLKLLSLRKDEDAFYDHYYTIEDDLPTFERSIQTDISKLVVTLAQG